MLNLFNEFNFSTCLTQHTPFYQTDKSIPSAMLTHHFFVSWRNLKNFYGNHILSMECWWIFLIMLPQRNNKHCMKQNEKYNGMIFGMQSMATPDLKKRTIRKFCLLFPFLICWDTKMAAKNTLYYPEEYYRRILAIRAACGISYYYFLWLFAFVALLEFSCACDLSDLCSFFNVVLTN